MLQGGYRGTGLRTYQRGRPPGNLKKLTIVGEQGGTNAVAKYYVHAMDAIGMDNKKIDIRRGRMKTTAIVGMSKLNAKA